MSNRSSLTIQDDAAASRYSKESQALEPSSEPVSIPSKPTPPTTESENSVGAWLLVLASFLLFVMTWGPATGFGAFETFYVSDLLKQYSPSTVSWIGSVQISLLVVTGVVAGPIFDRGHFRLLVCIGCAMMIVSFMLLSLCKDFYQVFLCESILFGVGSGLTYVPALAAVSARFQKRRAIAVGIVASGGSIGGIIFPILIHRLQPRVGFPWTARVIGFILLAISLVAVPIILCEPKHQNPPRKLFQPKIFAEPPFALMTLTCFLVFLAYWIPLFFIPTFASRRLHMSEDLSFYTLAIVNAGSTLGRVMPAFIAHKTGAVPVVGVSIFANAVLLFGWIGVNNTAGLYVFCVLFGFFSGVFPSILPLAIVSKPITPDISVFGTRLGMVWACGGIGTLIGSPIAGSLVNVNADSFIKAQAFAGAVMMGGFFTFVLPWIAVLRASKSTTSGPA